MNRKRTLTSEVRVANRSLIFHTLYEQGAQSKSQLRSLLGLSLPTIDQNLTELRRQGLLTATEGRQATGGRKAMEYAVDPEARFALGVDITANHIATAILDLLGGIRHLTRERLVYEPTAAYCAHVSAQLKQLLSDHGIAEDRVLGLGLSVPAIVSADARQLTYASLLQFTDGRLSDFEGCLPFPCRFINDATAGGFAEAWYNPDIRRGGRDQTIAYLSLSNSVGGAFLHLGSIYPGINQRASEFGHLTLHPGGRTCYCGQRGCADAYLSAKLLSDLRQGDLAAFFEALAAGDPACQAAFERYSDDLVLMINDLRMVYDCPVICGGYVGSHLTPYLDRLRGRLAQRNTFEPDGSYLLACAWRYEAAAVGAALNYLDAFIRGI